MLDKIKSHLQFGNKFCGIEHTTMNGNDTIITTIVKKAKNELTIHESFEFSNIENLSIKLPKKQHLYLIINNENIITKRIESELKDNIKLVYSSFPNINLDDFYYEVLNHGKFQFVSICRKSYVDSLIEKYKQLKFPILNFSLGNSPISNISEFIETEENIITSNAIITRQGNNIININKIEVTSSKNYEINGLDVSNTQLLSFSGALQAVLKSNNHSTNYEDQKQFLINDYNHLRFFRLFLNFAAILLLCTLLINFLFFSHYYSKINTLKETSLINQSTKENVITLNKSVSETQRKVDNLLKSNASKSSFYTNSIIQSLPNTIILSKLNYQPLEKRIKPNKPIELLSHTIIISGDSNSSATFSKWISELNTFNWVKSIETIAYSDISTSKSIFTIKINYE